MTLRDLYRLSREIRSQAVASYLERRLLQQRVSSSLTARPTGTYSARITTRKER